MQADGTYVRKEHRPGTSSQEALYRYFSVQKVSLEDALNEIPEVLPGEPPADEPEPVSEAVQEPEPVPESNPESDDFPEEAAEPVPDLSEPAAGNLPEEPPVNPLPVQAPVPNESEIPRRSSFMDWLRRLTK